MLDGQDMLGKKKERKKGRKKEERKHIPPCNFTFSSLPFLGYNDKQVTPPSPKYPVAHTGSNRGEGGKGKEEGGPPGVFFI